MALFIKLNVGEPVTCGPQSHLTGGGRERERERERWQKERRVGLAWHAYVHTHTVLLWLYQAQHEVKLKGSSDERFIAHSLVPTY